MYQKEQNDVSVLHVSVLLLVCLIMLRASILYYIWLQLQCLAYRRMDARMEEHRRERYHERHTARFPQAGQRGVVRERYLGIGKVT